MDPSDTPDDAPNDEPAGSTEPAGEATPVEPAPPPAASTAPPPAATGSGKGSKGPTSRYRLIVALLIVVASLAGAGVAWSASVSSTRASDLDQLSQQQFLEQQQILTSGRADIAEELRRVGTYQQQLQAEQFFDQQSKALAAKYPSLAAQLAAEAQGQASLARNTQALFFAAAPQVSSNGTVSYDRTQALNNLISQYVIYQQLHPEQIQAAAAKEHTKSGRIVGVGIILVAALFFLTLAQVAKSRTRHAFLVAGTAVLIVGLVLWVVVAL